MALPTKWFKCGEHGEPVQFQAINNSVRAVVIAKKFGIDVDSIEVSGVVCDTDNEGRIRLADKQGLTASKAIVVTGTSTRVSSLRLWPACISTSERSPKLHGPVTACQHMAMKAHHGYGVCDMHNLAQSSQVHQPEDGVKATHSCLEDQILSCPCMPQAATPQPSRFVKHT